MKFLRKEIIFNPAYDKTHKDPKKDYGIHGVDMMWYLKGELGAIQFVVYTNWHLPHVQKNLDARIDDQFPHLCCHPQPADVGYHSPTPQYEGQTLMIENCQVINGPCYYDSTCLQAQDIFNILVKEGGDAVWKEMEKFYIQRLGELK